LERSDEIAGQAMNARLKSGEGSAHQHWRTRPRLHRKIRHLLRKATGEWLLEAFHRSLYAPGLPTRIFDTDLVGAVQAAEFRQ
jgi:predicted transcriptional regulator